MSTIGEGQILSDSQVLALFEQKKHCLTTKEAFPDPVERCLMLKRLKLLGVYNMSWKRSCGHTMAGSAEYKRKWRADNPEKVSRHLQTFAQRKRAAS